MPDEFGRIDALVNNAGVAARERLPHLSLDAWQRTFDINVTGPMLGIQALGPIPLAGSVGGPSLRSGTGLERS